MQGHHGEIWALAVGKYGDMVVTASHDKSIRLWEKTDEQFVLQEEREEQIEQIYEEMDIKQDDEFNEAIGSGVEGSQTQAAAVGPATKTTAESMKSGELLLETLLVWENDRADHDKYEQVY